MKVKKEEKKKRIKVLILEETIVWQANPKPTIHRMESLLFGL